MGKTGKISSFIWRGVKITLLSLLLLVVIAFMLVQLPAVQTYMGRKASAYLSDRLKAKIEIKAINIDFFKTVNLEGVYVEDLRHDTLLYGNKLGCTIKSYSFRNEKIEFGVTSLENITCKLQKYKGEKGLNIDFIASYFSSPKTIKDSTPSNFNIEYGNLEVKNIRFVYRDNTDTANVKNLVNFSDLEVDRLSGKFDNLSYKGDSLRCDLSNLSFMERSGFEVRKLSAQVTISATNIKADNLLLFTRSSYIHGYYRMFTDGYDDYSTFIKDVDMQADFKDSTYINTSDLAYFVPEMHGLHEIITLKGLVKGSIANLNSDDLALSFGKHTEFKGRINVKGLPNLDKTFFVVEADKLSSSYTDMSEVPAYPFSSGEKITVPVNLKTLGVFTFRGKAEGFTNDMFVNGSLSTALGKVSMRASMNVFDKNVSYSGNFKTEKFNVGKLIAASSIGEISMTMHLSGSGTSVKTLVAEAHGAVQGIQVHGYNYKNIILDGYFKREKFTGDITASDTNARFSFLGGFDLSQKIPQFDFTLDIKSLNLFKCNLLKDDSASVLSGEIKLTSNGNSLNDLNADMKLEDIKLLRSNGTIKLDNVDLVLAQDETSNSLQLASSAADVSVQGKFRLTTLPQSIAGFLNFYFPTFFKEDKKIKNTSDELTFKIRVKDITPVADFFKVPLKISKGSELQGSFSSKNNSLNITGLSSLIDYKKTPLKNWQLSISTKENSIRVNTGFSRIELTDSIHIDSFDVDLKAFNNTSDFAISWNNNSLKKNSAEIDGKLFFTSNTLDLDLGKFLIYAEDSLWQMTGNDHFIVDSSGVLYFHDLTFKNNNQFVKIEGKLSPNPKDQLLVELENFKLKQLNPLIKRNGLDLQGSITGTANFSDVFKKFVFTTALDFKNLEVNNTPLGTGQINSFYDKNKEEISMNGFFKKEFEKIDGEAYNNIRFDGYYYPTKKDSNLNVDLHFYQFSLAAIRPLVKGIFTINKGNVTGDVKIKGSTSKPNIHGLLELEQVKNFKVDYLNTSYDVKGNIRIEPGQMDFENIVLTDANKNTATVYGNIFYQDFFNNMKLDFDINANDFMLLNTTAAENSSYYGKAYCTGNIGLYGPPSALTFDINVKTNKGTKFIIPLSGPGQVGENGFIKFVKIDSANKELNNKNDLEGITLNFNLEATPDAEVQIIMDPRAGDGIKAKGRGALSLNIDTRGKFEMFGSYYITDGSYLFTLQNVINKKFDIDEGSMIHWNGDPYDADINITATYKQRTSIAPFFPEENSANSGGDNNKRYLVNCKMYLKNKLMNPDITFGIELPTVSEVIRSQVMGYINNEQELSRQFFALLLLRTFVAPSQLAGSNASSGAGSAASNNASEVISNQLNSVLSKFTKSFNLGFNYRPSSVTSNEEVDVALSTQLFSDKLTIDGNVGVNNNAVTGTSTLIGDINLDYRLTKDNKVHVRAFNRSNDNFQIATLGGQFTQGAGILYREEFNTLGDFYRRFLLHKKPKTDTTLVKP